MAPSSDDERPAGPVLTLTQAELETLSVHELEARRQALEAEIARIQDMIAAKRDSRSAAEAVFGKG